MIRHPRFLATLLGVWLSASPSILAATYTWDPAGNRSDAAGSGSWDTTSVVWDNGTADTTWANGTNTPTFNGADGTYTVTVANGLSSGDPIFNASGYTLVGGTLTITSAVASTYSQLFVATGKTLTIGSNMTVNAAQGTTNIDDTAGYGGTLDVNNGGKLVFGTDGSIGGALNVGANSTVGSTFFTGTMSGGSITVNGVGAAFNVRGLGLSNSTVTVDQGTFNCGGGMSTTLATSTVNLNGGTFVAGYFSSSDARSTFNLNGGVFQNTNYGGITATGQLMKMVVQSGGAKFDLSFNMIIPVPLQHDAAGPAIDGGLTKTSAGTLTIEEPGTYTGGTLLLGGSLVVAANGALGTGGANVLSTGICLTIDAGVNNPFNGAEGKLTLAGGGTANKADVGYIDLTSGADITVDSLVLGTTTYTSGVFTSAEYPDYILGTGTITVVPEPGSLAPVLASLGAAAAAGARRRVGNA